MTDRTGPVTIRDVADSRRVSPRPRSAECSPGSGAPGRLRLPPSSARCSSSGTDPPPWPARCACAARRPWGLIVTDIQNPFFPELVQAADVAARKLGYSILLGSAAYDEHRAMHYLDLMVDRRVDGLLIASSQLSEASWGLGRSDRPSPWWS